MTKSAIETDINGRVSRLERKYRFALVIAVITSACGIIAVAGSASSRTIAATTNQTSSKTLDSLRVRELDVVDGNGVTRVKIGAPLANAVIDGKPLTRGAPGKDAISGILLFDADGVERSGYATVNQGYSNVLLTLDDKHKQHAMFIAEPTGATTLRLFNADTNDRVDLSVDKDGPSISMVKQGKEIYRAPAE